MTVNVLFKKTSEDAKAPIKHHNSDFCYDVFASSVEEVAPNIYRYGLGLAFEVMSGEEFNEYVTGITFRPRSSIWKTGLMLSNGIGTIDFDYRGETSAVFYHVMPNMPKYEVGDRIGQIHLDATYHINFTEMTELSETKRGDGGYGSTGR